MSKLDVKSISFHKNMEPVHSIKVFTHTLNGEDVGKGLSIALYSPEPQTDWCVRLTPEEALQMAHKIIDFYGKGEVNDQAQIQS